jgi:hypothetical protein
MIRDPRIYAAVPARSPVPAARAPLTLVEELNLIRGEGGGDGGEISLHDYEAALALLLGAGQAHYSPVLKRLYFWGDLAGRTLGVLRAAYGGAGLPFLPGRLHMDVHGYFQCLYRVDLPDSGYAAVMVALLLSGIGLRLRCG